MKIGGMTKEMKKKIVLYYDNIRLSELTQSGNGYKHIVNDRNVKKAISRGCLPIIGSGTRVYDDIPPCFYDLEYSPHRQDLREKYGVNRGDSRFERLYKKALLGEPVSDDFWISVE